MSESRSIGGERAVRALVAAIATVGLVLLLATAPARGSTWTGRQLSGEAAKVVMFGVSCPSASLCVAVGGNNTIASSTNPTGDSASWNVAYAGTGATPTGPRETFAGKQIRGVSCPSPQLCVAVTFEGLIYTATNPVGGPGAWSVTDLDPSGPSTHLYGVSCPSPTFCAAAAGGGKVAVSTNPTGGAAAWSVTQLETPLELRGISCASPSLCVAVGDDGDGVRPQPTNSGEIVSSTNPLGGAWQRVEIPGAGGSLYGVSCALPALCVTGNVVGQLLLSSAPTGPASGWTPIDGGGTVQITDVDCLSSTQCVAVDNNADVLTSTNPSGGAGAWTFTNVLPYPGVDETAANGTFGVSCPSTSLCAVASAGGQILTSSDPFATAPAPPKTTDKKKRNRERPRRPHVTIASQPPGAIELERRKLTARFRFFAQDHAQVRGFACKLDGRRVKHCRSPKGYRVSFGRHVFKVRAIGWTGVKGPAAIARFRVCHPTPYPECLRHLPPIKARPSHDYLDSAQR